MSDIREILDSLSKQDLIELLIEYSDNGYFSVGFISFEGGLSVLSRRLDKGAIKRIGSNKKGEWIIL